VERSCRIEDGSAAAAERNADQGSSSTRNTLSQLEVGVGKAFSGAGTSGTRDFLEEAEDVSLGGMTALCWKPQLGAVIPELGRAGTVGGASCMGC